jgi:hypothetical protein
MVATPKIARHAAPADWTKTHRETLARQLAERGTTIGELSDARELCGHERLSDASPADRAAAVQNLDAPEIQRALVTVRTCRAWLLEQLASCPKKAIADAKVLLDLRTRRGALKATGDLRLGELSALVGVATEAPRTRRAVEVTPIWTEEELFAGAVGL